MPDAMELIFQAALALGRAGAVNLTHSFTTLIHTLCVEIVHVPVMIHV